MTSFEKYSDEMDAFRQSRLFAEKYAAVLSYLEENCEGREKVTCGDIICEDRDISPVQLRAIVSHARREGVPIASCGDGYFLARNYAELQCTVDHMTERRDSISFTISRLKSCFPDEAQANLFKEGV